MLTPNSAHHVGVRDLVEETAERGEHERAGEAGDEADRCERRKVAGRVRQLRHIRREAPHLHSTRCTV